MVVLLKTTKADGEKLQGNGLLIYVKFIGKEPRIFLSETDKKALAVDLEPVIITLCHVVGLDDRDDSNEPLPDIRFMAPGGKAKDAFKITGVIKKLPLDQIDPTLAEKIAPKRDGVCLLRPPGGYTPKVISPTQLAIPSLNQNDEIPDYLTVYFARERDRSDDTVVHHFIRIQGRARKNGYADSFNHPASPGVTGPGMSGASILPADGDHPPAQVLGLHVGKMIDSPPPEPHYFLGTRAIADMLRKAGYYVLTPNLEPYAATPKVRVAAPSPSPTPASGNPGDGAIVLVDSPAPGTPAANEHSQDWERLVGKWVLAAVRIFAP